MALDKLRDKKLTRQVTAPTHLHSRRRQIEEELRHDEERYHLSAPPRSFGRSCSLQVEDATDGMEQLQLLRLQSH